jgi:predicted TPR repeat methyltransferase
MTDPEVPIDDWLYQGPTDAQQVAGRYDEWAASYDADLASWSYKAPARVAETALTRLPDAGSILDVGCGTGMVGSALRAKGYEGQLLGLDISEASLRVAEGTGVYDRLETADLQQPLQVTENSVNVLVCVGVMTYLPDVEAVWREFARVVRSGGLVIATMREDLWEPRDCQGVIDQLEVDGVWKSLEVTGPAPYLPDATGGLAGQRAYYLTAEVS